MISIENLRHFVAVVENRGVNSAAAKIAISPSSLTRSIRGIEEQLGKQVFDRVGRKVLLNSAGQEFYPRAKSLIEDFESLTVGKSSSYRLVGHYRIGASHFLCKSILAKKISELASLYPHASFDVLSLDTNVVVGMLHRGNIDLGVCFSPKPTDTLSRTVLSKGTLYLSVGRKNKLSDVSFSKLAKKLSAMPAIMHRSTESADRCDNHPMYEAHGIKPKIRMYWDSDEVAVQMLSTGRYWTMLPDVVIDAHPEIKRLPHPKTWIAPYEICLLRNKQRTAVELEKLITG